jgi:exonuclease VII small subunit
MPETNETNTGVEQSTNQEATAAAVETPKGVALYNELQEILTGAEKDFSKFFDKEQEAPGKRIRAAMQALKRKAHEIRQLVSEEKANRSTKA